MAKTCIIRRLPGIPIAHAQRMPFSLIDIPNWNIPHVKARVMEWGAISAQSGLSD